MAATTLVTSGLEEIVVQSQNSIINYVDLIDTVHTFGRVFLPSIYGKDLSAFEIASSGKIVLTLNDTHALDIKKDDDLSIISIVPAQNANLLELSLVDDLAHVKLNPFAQSIDIAAASDLYMLGTSNLQIGTADDMAVMSMQGSNLYLTSHGTLAMSTANQQAYVSIDTTKNDVNIYSSNNCQIFSEGDVIVNARSMKIHVAEYNLSYSFRPTSTGSLSLIQTIYDSNNNATDYMVAKFGTPILL